MNKWSMKLFRRLLSATRYISLIVHAKRVEQKVDHLKFRIDFIDGVSIKYSMHCKMPVYHFG
jgi:hypothetical protein